MDESTGQTGATSRRPLRLATAVAVAAVVVAVVTALSVPHWLSDQGRTRSVVPRPPEPVHRLELPGTRTWQTVDCPPSNEDTCAAPVLLDHAGVMFRRVGANRLDVDPTGDDHVLTMAVPASRSDRWVLVGGERASADSRLTITLGGSPAVSVPAGRLSLFPLRGSARLVVRVSDEGDPRDEEVLRIAQYVAR